MELSFDEVERLDRAFGEHQPAGTNIASIAEWSLRTTFYRATLEKYRLSLMLGVSNHSVEP